MPLITSGTINDSKELSFYEEQSFYRGGRASYFVFMGNIHMDVLKSSTMVRKYKWPYKEGIGIGPKYQNEPYQNKH